MQRQKLTLFCFVLAMLLCLFGCTPGAQPEESSAVDSFTSSTVPTEDDEVEEETTATVMDTTKESIPTEMSTHRTTTGGKSTASSQSTTTTKTTTTTVTTKTTATTTTTTTTRDEWWKTLTRFTSDTTTRTAPPATQSTAATTATPYEQVAENVYRLGEGTGLRVLFVGNSITLHGPSEAVGWTGNWGMAASSLGRDYVHVSMNRIRETHPDAAFAVCSSSTWEVNYRTADQTLLESYAEARKFDADILVIRLGENCENVRLTEEERNVFVSQLEKLVDYLNEDGEAAVLLTGSFWESHIEDGLIAYAFKHSCPFVELKDLGSQDRYKAIGQYWHSGVCSHPNNTGMAAIAQRICDALEQLPTFQVPPEG